MEVLNKNQRESAIWRLIGLGVIILTLVAAILFSSYKAFETKGSGEEDRLRRELELCNNKALAEQQRLKNNINALEADIKNLKTELKNLEPEKKNLKSACDLWKERYEAADRELNRCLQMSKANG